MKKLGLRLMGAPGTGVDTRPIKLCLFGDSISAQNTNISAPYTYMEGLGYAVALNAMARQRYEFEIPYNLGVSGDKTTQMLARVGSIPADANIVIVLGGTNDLANEVAASTIQSNLRSIYNSILASGKKVVAVKILPRGGWGAFNSGQIATAEASRASVNTWIGQQGDVIVVDAENAFKPGGTLDATLFYDGAVHPGQRGAWVLASEINKVLKPRFGIGSLLKITENNLLPNSADFTGTGGAVSSYFTGTLATGWSASGGTSGVGTMVLSKNADDSQRVAINIPAAAAEQTGTLKHASNVTTGYTVGDKVVAEFDLEVISAINASWLGVELRDVGGTIYYAMGYDKEASGLPIPTGMGRCTIKTPEITVQSGNTKLELRLRLSVAPTAGAAGELIVNVYGARVRKV